MLHALGQLGGYIMTPLYYLTSSVLLAFHHVLGSVFGDASGIAWVLSIVGLTLTIRAALIPLFVKQIKSSRNMQLLQPKVKELQKKYGHDRERLSRETMALYKETGTNPFASCLPLILQMPIFLALFRLIDQAVKHPDEPRGLMSSTLNDQFRDATLLGAKISDSFTGTELTGVRVLAAVLVIAMTATTFLTQRQLMSKNMPADAMSGQYAQQQKMLLYVLPLVFAIGGIAFPIGVLFYWTTSNLWTMGQQFYVIRNNPAPGTPAARAKLERDVEKRRRKGLPDPTAPAEAASPTIAPEPTKPVSPQRQQPKKQTRSQRASQGRKQGPPTASKPAASSDDSTPTSQPEVSTATGSGSSAAHGPASDAVTSEEPRVRRQQTRTPRGGPSRRGGPDTTRASAPATRRGSTDRVKADDD